MKRQKYRKLLLTVSLLLFPITLYYFSPALIINAGLNGIINGSFIIFLLQFLLAIPFGRSFCAYLCPAGGLQECVFAINDNLPKQGWKNNIKYIIWFIWFAIVIFCYYYHVKNFSYEGIAKVDFFFETENGISVSSVQSYIIYYGIILLVFIPSVFFGKRIFCHYFCWMAPFMVLGTKLGRKLHLPGLHIRIKAKGSCVSCGKCNRECPMGLAVSDMIKEGCIENPECIQCGVCVDSCPQKVLAYEMINKSDNKKKQDRMIRSNKKK